MVKLTRPLVREVRVENGRKLILRIEPHERHGAIIEIKEKRCRRDECKVRLSLFGLFWNGLKRA